MLRKYLSASTPALRDQPMVDSLECPCFVCSLPSIPTGMYDEGNNGQL